MLAEHHAVRRGPRPSASAHDLQYSYPSDQSAIRPPSPIRPTSQVPAEPVASPTTRWPLACGGRTADAIFRTGFAIGPIRGSTRPLLTGLCRPTPRTCISTLRRTSCSSATGDGNLGSLAARCHGHRLARPSSGCAYWRAYLAEVVRTATHERAGSQRVGPLVQRQPPVGRHNLSALHSRTGEPPCSSTNADSVSAAVTGHPLPCTPRHLTGRTRWPVLSGARAPIGVGRTDFTAQVGHSDAWADHSTTPPLTVELCAHARTARTPRRVAVRTDLLLRALMNAVHRAERAAR